MHRLRSARVKRAFSLGERAIPFSAYRGLARAIIRDDNFIPRCVNFCARGAKLLLVGVIFARHLSCFVRRRRDIFSHERIILPTFIT